MSDHFVVRQRRLRRARNCQFLQVVHEDLQADVICENWGTRLLQIHKKQIRQKQRSRALYAISGQNFIM